MPGAGRRGPGPPGCVVVAAACTSLSRRARGARGGVREWLNRAVSKTVVWATPAPRVRIPPPPPKQGVLRSVGLLTGSTRHSGCRSLFGRSDSYDVISIDAEPGTSGAALAKAIKPMLATNLQVKDVAGGASEAEADWKGSAQLLSHRRPRERVALMRHVRRSGGSPGMPRPAWEHDLALLPDVEYFLGDGDLEEVVQAIGARGESNRHRARPPPVLLRAPSARAMETAVGPLLARAPDPIGRVLQD